MSCTNSKIFDCYNCDDPRKFEEGSYCCGVMKGLQEFKPPVNIAEKAKTGYEYTAKSISVESYYQFFETLKSVLDQKWGLAKKYLEEAAIFDLQTIAAGDKLNLPDDVQKLKIQTAKGLITIGQSTSLMHLTIGVHDLDKLARSNVNSTIAFEIVTSIVKLKEIRDRALAENYLYFDTETTGLKIWAESFFIVGMGLGFKSTGDIYYVPMNHQKVPLLHEMPLVRHENQITHTDFYKVMKPVFASETVLKSAHNIKYDILVNAKYGVPCRGPIWDSMQALYVIDSRQPKSLKVVAKNLWNRDCTHFGDLIAKYGTYNFAPILEGADYCAWDIENGMDLENYTREKITEMGFQNIMELDLNAIRPLAKMEYFGMTVDINKLLGEKERAEEELDQVTAAFYEQIKTNHLNANSSPQVQELLFKKMKIGSRLQWNQWRLDMDEKKFLPSTGKTNLTKIKNMTGNNVVDKILRIRKLNKYIGTYLKPTLGKNLMANNRVYPSMNNATAKSGRLSSSNPNFQNLITGVAFKECFISRFPDGRFVIADWSQVELRVYAVMARIYSMIQSYIDKKDNHQSTGDLVCPKTLEYEDAKKRRKIGKTLNFGMVYGMGPGTFADDLGITYLEASKHLKAYHKAYPELDVYFNEIRKQLRCYGWVETSFGRRRYYDLKKGSVEEWIRSAVNHTIQGTAADMIRMTLPAVDAAIMKQIGYGPSGQLRAILNLTIHDEIIVDTIDKYVAKDVYDILEDEMTFIFSHKGLEIPIECDGGILKHIKK